MSQYVAQCADCFPNDETAAICLLCLATEHKNHNIINFKKANAYCDCGAGEGNKCKNLPKKIEPSFISKIIKKVTNSNNNTSTTVMLSKDELSSNHVNNFTLNLFSGRNKENNTFVVSPASVLFCLSMFYKGTNGETETEIQKALGTPKIELFESLVKLNNLLNKSLTLTNSVYVNDKFKNSLVKQYVDDIQSLGNFKTMDVNNPQEVADCINSLIAKKTNNLITELIQADQINDDSLIILLNTIYFKADWMNKFYKGSTIKNFKFNGLNGVKKIDMMTMREEDFKYYEDNENQILEMAYKDETTKKRSNYVMGFVLPKSNESSNITPKLFESYWSNMRSAEIELLQIPKFTVETSFTLNDDLKALGMNKMFSSADLKNMINVSQDIYVSTVAHKAVIIVDETGTEAAAATSMHLQLESCRIKTGKPVKFIADHPFTYYIKETSTNTLVFIGKYM
jgi:serine protease inhibitor